jgi:hypothetical protein
MNVRKGIDSADLTSRKLSFAPMDFHECSSKKEMANNWVKIPDKMGESSKYLNQNIQILDWK